MESNDALRRIEVLKLSDSAAKLREIRVGTRLRWICSGSPIPLNQGVDLKSYYSDPYNLRCLPYLRGIGLFGFASLKGNASEALSILFNPDP